VRAVVIDEPGGPDALRVRQVPDPVPGPGEVVITTVAAGVNRADLAQRLGLYPPPPGASPYLGLECSGHISAVGTGVPDWREGDAVCALLTGGGYAEQVAVPVGQLLPIPAGVSVLDAAALPEATCTVHSNVLRDGRLAPGEVLLVHGGSSGIGTTAIQVARAIGARAICTAGSADKLLRRFQRHRHDGYPGSPRDWCKSHLHGGFGGQAAEVPRAGRRASHQLPRAGLRRRRARLH
jgi:NADPH:quinone reductase-like Zn-dependent oxidoreductase